MDQPVPLVGYTKDCYHFPWVRVSSVDRNALDVKACKGSEGVVLGWRPSVGLPSANPPMILYHLDETLLCPRHIFLVYIQFQLHV